MPARIEINDRGIATLEIHDADGALHSYRLERAPCGLSVWASAITRLDSGASYRVTLEVGGGWRCNCPWFTKGRQPAPRTCKHCISVAPLYRFLVALTKEPARDRPHSSAV